MCEGEISPQPLHKATASTPRTQRGWRVRAMLCAAWKQGAFQDRPSHLAPTATPAPGAAGDGALGVQEPG